MYFDRCKTVEEVKDKFKRLAKLVHPDHGGDVALMQEINTEYDKALYSLKNTGQVKPAADKPPSMANRLIDIILDWAENNPSFDTGFVRSLERRLAAGVQLTMAQEASLSRIISKFKIKV